MCAQGQYPIHTYTHFPASSEHVESFRPVDRNSLNLPYISLMALGPAACLYITSGKLGQTSLGSTPNFINPLSFTSYMGRGQHYEFGPRPPCNITQIRHKNETNKVRNVCRTMGPFLNPTGEHNHSTHESRQHCLQPLGLAGPKSQQKVQSKQKNQVGSPDIIKWQGTMMVVTKYTTSCSTFT